MVKEENGKWYVYSEEGKRLSSGYSSKSEADKRLGQIEYFKHQDEETLKLMCDELDYEDAEYQGKSVTLNKPFRTSGESKKFAVYAKNSKGNVVKVRFGDPDMEIKRDDPDARKNFRSRHKCDLQKDKSTPGYWSCRMWGAESVKSMTDYDFKHRVFFDMATKKIRSVRDGVQEYLGVELGIEPHDRVFTVYRSPETISSIAGDMDGLPIINDHIDPSVRPDESQIIGRVSNTDIVEELVDDYDSTLVLENKANISDEMLKLRDGGKKEFSLGYTGKMREHDTYDFEQYDIGIKTGHLALVDAARGGSLLTFVDKKESEMDKIFLDAEGSVNLQKIVEISSQLSEAIKTVPLDKLTEVIPVLEEVVMYGKQGDPADAMDEDMGDEEVTDMEEEKMDMDEAMDMDYEDMEEEDKEKFGDSKLIKTFLKSQEKTFSDSKAFKDAIKSGVEQHISVVEKAKDFLPENYNFADNSTIQVMRDAVTAMVDDEFTDAELPAAFKMLKKSDQYKTFGDTADELEALKDKEL